MSCLLESHCFTRPLSAWLAGPSPTVSFSSSPALTSREHGHVGCGGLLRAGLVNWGHGGWPLPSLPSSASEVLVSSPLRDVHLGPGPPPQGIFIVLIPPPSSLSSGRRLGGWAAWVYPPHRELVFVITLPSMSTKRMKPSFLVLRHLLSFLYQCL